MQRNGRSLLEISGVAASLAGTAAAATGPVEPPAAEAPAAQRHGPVFAQAAGEGEG